MDSLSFLVGRAIHLTYAGAEKVAQLSQNKQAIKNRNDVLVLLKKYYSELLISMKLSLSNVAINPNSDLDDRMIDQRRTARAQFNPQSEGQIEACLDDVSMQVVNVDTIAKSHTAIKRFLPVLRAKNREEIDHFKSINLAESERLDIQRERNEMESKHQKNTHEAELKHQKNTHEQELKHKDEMQKRLRIERDEYLEFEQKKQDLNQKKRRWEHHQRSTVDPNETESDSD